MWSLSGFAVALCQLQSCIDAICMAVHLCKGKPASPKGLWVPRLWWRVRDTLWPFSKLFLTLKILVDKIHVCWHLLKWNQPTNQQPPKRTQTHKKACRNTGFVFIHEQEALIYLMFVCITLTSVIYQDYLLFIDLCKHWPHTPSICLNFCICSEGFWPAFQKHFIVTSF